jgi:hypothetical protein
MPSTDDPASLLRQAAALRRLAGALDGSPAHRLPSLAGDDTWFGPTADRFRADALALGRALDDATSALWRAARSLESQAAALAGPRAM